MNYLRNKRNIIFIAVIFTVILIALVFAYLNNYTCVLGHDYQKATCERPQICSLCNHQVGEAMEHSFQKSNEVLASCTVSGVATYVCSECQFSKTENIPMVAHDFIEKDSLSPSCTESGYTLYECSMCQIQKEENFAAMNHIISNGKCERCNQDFKAKKNEFLSQIKQNDNWINEALSYAYTQSELNSITSEELNRWDKLLNKIYQYLKSIMIQTEFEDLQVDERNWVSRKEKDVKKFADECTLGSAAVMEINSYESRITEERCYYLLSKLDEFIK